MAASKNHVENVAIVGVGGRMGGVVVDHLLKGQKHRVTAITRPDSTTKVPAGVHDVNKADYNDHKSLVKALEGQDVLVITMNVSAPPESHFKLVDAAVEARVKYIMPNERGVDMTKVEMSKDTFMYDRLLSVRQHIEKVGGAKTHWIGICCSFWYEFSLAGTEARYGFDLDKKTVTLYSGGNTKINTSTWPQVGAAVASLLSLKIRPDSEDDKSICLRYENKSAHVSSFFVSQRDMLESVLRVTGDKEEDWTVTEEDVVERYHRGLKLLQQGVFNGFGILLYARAFYPDKAGDFNERLDNEKLGLQKESLDEATKVAIDMALRGETNAIH